MRLSVDPVTPYLSLTYLQEDVAATWRGPMVMSALESFIRGVAWGDLDVLVIDMPPGTGQNNSFLKSQQAIGSRRRIPSLCGMILEEALIFSLLVKDLD